MLYVAERQDMELGIAFFVGRRSWNPILGSNFTMRRDYSKLIPFLGAAGIPTTTLPAAINACNPTSKFGGKKRDGDYTNQNGSVLHRR